MKRPDRPWRFGTLLTALTAGAGVIGGLAVALCSFIQLRTAWLDGVVVFGRRGANAFDFDYDSEPLSYIAAMSALYPAAIVCGAGIAVASAIVLARLRSSSTRDRRKSASR